MTSIGLIYLNFKKMRFICMQCKKNYKYLFLNYYWFLIKINNEFSVIKFGKFRYYMHSKWHFLIPVLVTSVNQSSGLLTWQPSQSTPKPRHTSHISPAHDPHCWTVWHFWYLLLMLIWKCCTRIPCKLKKEKNKHGWWNYCVFSCWNILILIIF